MDLSQLIQEQTDKAMIELLDAQELYLQGAADALGLTVEELAKEYVLEQDRSKIEVGDDLTSYRVVIVWRLKRRDDGSAKHVRGTGL